MQWPPNSRSIRKASIWHWFPMLWLSHLAREPSGPQKFCPGADRLAEGVLAPQGNLRNNDCHSHSTFVAEVVHLLGISLTLHLYQASHGLTCYTGVTWTVLNQSKMMYWLWWALSTHHHPSAFLSAPTTVKQDRSYKAFENFEETCISIHATSVHKY